MSLRLIIRPEAEGDIATTRRWYEERGRGLSIEFRSALDGTLSSIADNPELYARVYRNESAPPRSAVSATALGVPS